jgi:hypothetical protein
MGMRGGGGGWSLMASLVGWDLWVVSWPVEFRNEGGAMGVESHGQLRVRWLMVNQMGRWVELGKGKEGRVMGVVSTSQVKEMRRGVMGGV